MAISSFVDSVHAEQDNRIANLANAAVGFVGEMANLPMKGIDARNSAYTMAMNQRMNDPNFEQQDASLLFASVDEETPEAYKGKTIEELMDSEGGSALVHAQYEKIRKEATLGGKLNELSLTEQGRKTRDLMDERIKMRGIQTTLLADKRNNEVYQAIAAEYKAFSLQYLQNPKAKLSGEQQAKKTELEKQVNVAKQRLSNVVTFAKNYITDPNEYDKIISGAVSRIMLLSNKTMDNKDFAENTQTQLREWLQSMNLGYSDARIDGLIVAVRADVNNAKRQGTNANYDLLRDNAGTLHYPSNVGKKNELIQAATRIRSDKSMTREQRTVALINEFERITGKDYSSFQGQKQVEVIPDIWAVVADLTKPPAPKEDSPILEFGTKPIGVSMQAAKIFKSAGSSRFFTEWSKGLSSSQWGKIFSNALGISILKNNDEGNVAFAQSIDALIQSSELQPIFDGLAEAEKKEVKDILGDVFQTYRSASFSEGANAENWHKLAPKAAVQGANYALQFIEKVMGVNDANFENDLARTRSDIDGRANVSSEAERKSNKYLPFHTNILESDTNAITKNALNVASDEENFRNYAPIQTYINKFILSDTSIKNNWHLTNKDVRETLQKNSIKKLTDYTNATTLLRTKVDVSDFKTEKDKLAAIQYQTILLEAQSIAREENNDAAVQRIGFILDFIQAGINNVDNPPQK